MFQPGRLAVDIEHVFARADEPAFGGAEVARIVAAGRLPMVTVEPMTWPTDAHLREWDGALFGQADDFIPVLVRYGHEFNLAAADARYPWCGDPARFRREWRRFADAVPGNVETVWSPNVSYPGSAPMAAFWPDGDEPDWLGVDGYSWNGESFAEVFGPSVAEVRAFSAELPLMVAETAAPRGRGQTRFARDAGDAVRGGAVQACLWFNTDKRGEGDHERDWRLSGPAARALLGRWDGPRIAPEAAPPVVSRHGRSGS